MRDILQDLIAKHPWMGEYLNLDELQNTAQWPKVFKCRFIEPGLVHYENIEATLLVCKPALDKMAQTFVGKPVINRMHAPVRPEDFADGKAAGIVTKVWFDNSDGWYWCEFLAWDPTLVNDCQSGKYSVSCSYLPTEVEDVPGIYHSIPYDGEIKNGEYMHMATVSDPRYEGAFITNSKGGSTMSWKFWKKGKDDKGNEVMNSSEVGDDAAVEIDGKKVAVKDLIAMHNSHSTISVLTDEAFVEHDGRKITIKELKAAYALQNEADKEKEKKEKEEKDNSAAHNSGAHKENRLENCALCNSEKEDEDKEKKKEKEKENSEHFNKLKEKANARGEGVEAPATMLSKREKAEQGRLLYGSDKK